MIETETVGEAEPPEPAPEAAPARPVYRLLAFAVDALVICLTLLVPALVGMLAGLDLALALLAFAVTLVSYLALSVWLTEGATLGKAVFGLEVRRIDGTPPARTPRGLLWSIARHSVGYLVIDVLGFGIAVALIDRRGRCPHDYAFGSEVVVLTSRAATLSARCEAYVTRLEAGLDAGAETTRWLAVWTRMSALALWPATLIAILAGKLADSTGGKLWEGLQGLVGGTPSKPAQPAAQQLTTKATVTLWTGTTAATGIILLLLADPAGPTAIADVNVVFANQRVGQPKTGEIHLMKADGSRSRRLTTNDVEDSSPDLFRDRRIVFTRRQNDDYDLYAMDADGTNERRLTGHPGNDVHPRWSGDGERIAFASDREGDLDIYVMDSGGGDLQRLTRDEAADSQPAWSRDDKLAFVSDRSGYREIYVTDADGTDLRRLRADPANDTEPAWSPDGEQIAFVSDRDGNPEIYLMDADGANLRRLTDDEANDNSPRWAPDGKHVLLESDRDLTSGGEEIYAVGVNGGPARRLTRWNVL